MSAILMELMLQFSKFQNSLRKSRNFAETFCRNSVASFRVSPHPETEFHIWAPPARRTGEQARPEVRNLGGAGDGQPERGALQTAPGLDLACPRSAPHDAEEPLRIFNT